jgi:hypothetical protein
MKKLVQMVVAAWIMITPLVAFSDDHNELASTVYGQSITLEVQNPTAVVAAMNRFNSSESGKAYPGTVLLNEMVAGGETNVTHQISVFFPSSAALDASNTNSVGNPDAMAFGMTMQQSASIAGRGLFRMMRGKGNVSTPGAVTYQIQLEVTDRAAFMKAFDRLWTSDAFANFPGGIYFGDTMGNGTNPSTHWVSFVAPNLETLYAGMDAIQGSAAMAAYSKNANQFRNYSANYVTRTLLRMGGEYR